MRRRRQFSEALYQRPQQEGLGFAFLIPLIMAAASVGGSVAAAKLKKPPVIQQTVVGDSSGSGNALSKFSNNELAIGGIAAAALFVALLR